ncbi:MAG: DUF2330 domain-containing protein [Syntrophobacteraceae bacterium]|jgi:hypothetical protein
MKKISILLVPLLLLCAPYLFADGGLISLKQGVRMFKPNQRAMIAWNGSKEILLLSTDMRASEATQVLEVVPLPTEPKVKKGDVETFRRATALINRKIRRPTAGRRGGKAAPASGRPAGEVTFHKKIGAHDISVAHVLSTDGFIAWVEKYLGSLQVQNPAIPLATKKIIDEYLAGKFTWFVFDVISLDEVLSTGEAVEYQFKTKFLYYPMKITQTVEGATTVDLLVLSPKLLDKFPGIPISQVQLRHEPVSITSEELRGLNPDMDALLGHREDMKLRIWRLQGEISSFQQDLIAQ